MLLQNIWQFVQDHPWVVGLIGVSLAFLQSKMGIHFWYLAAIAGAAIIAVGTGYNLYFWPFLLGMTTAFAEIISKFDDEPMKALKTFPALLYHVLNGMIAAFALYLLALVAGKPTNFSGVADMEQVKYAMAAGFGAMLIMRSKLFNIKVGDDNVSFGPEQIINIIFRFMESVIGRIRARARRQFIEEKLNNIKFDAVYPRSVMTLRRASRTMTPDDLKKCLDDLGSVKKKLDALSGSKKTDAEIQLRSYELGYVIYDKLGEDFVSDLFSNPRPEWLIRPPDPDDVKNKGVLPVLGTVQADNALVRAVPFLGTKEETVAYMAYGTNMSSIRIREKLNWLDSEGKESLEKTKPTPCVLKDYRLAFNRRSESKPNEEGLANIISENGQEVEGILYQLPKTTLEFLKSNEPGYHTIKVKVQVRNKATDKLADKETEAEVLVADANRVGENLKPNRADLISIIEGAAEHGLSKSYQDTLKGFDPMPESPVVTALTGNGGGLS